MKASWRHYLFVCIGNLLPPHTQLPSDIRNSELWVVFLHLSSFLIAEEYVGSARLLWSIWILYSNPPSSRSGRGKRLPSKPEVRKASLNNSPTLSFFTFLAFVFRAFLAVDSFAAFGMLYSKFLRNKTNGAQTTRNL